jgi:hypothetical protein
MNVGKQQEDILKLILDKIEDNTLRVISEHYKRKYVNISISDHHGNFNPIREECTIRPYQGLKNKRWLGGFTILLKGTYNHQPDIIREVKFNTWYEGTHRGYGDCIMGSGYSGNVFLNIDNLGNPIEYPEIKLITDDYKSPQLKYYDEDYTQYENKEAKRELEWIEEGNDMYKI